MTRGDGILIYPFTSREMNRQLETRLQQALIILVKRPSSHLLPAKLYDTIRDAVLRCAAKADMSQLNLPYGNDN